MQGTNFRLHNVTGMGSDGGRRQIGEGGEHIACLFLARKGYKILERNYRRKCGEIDIVAEKDGIVRFVEVKAVTREASRGFSREMDYRPEELVHKTKLRKVARTALLYMEERRDRREYQIDVVGVIIYERNRIAKCRIFEQALEENL